MCVCVCVCVIIDSSIDLNVLDSKKEVNCQTTNRDDLFIVVKVCIEPASLLG